MQRVFVCAGMRLANNEKINHEARILGEILAKNNVEYVQGGAACGLMGETLKSFLKFSKNVTSVVPQLYAADDLPELKKLSNEIKIIKVKSELDRLKVIKECDRVIVLPGGTGTLEELMFCNEILRSGEDKSKLELINIDGYFDGFIQLIKEVIKQGLTGSTSINFDVLSSVKELKF